MVRNLLLRRNKEREMPINLISSNPIYYELIKGFVIRINKRYKQSCKERIVHINIYVIDYMMIVILCLTATSGYPHFYLGGRQCVWFVRASAGQVPTALISNHPTTFPISSPYNQPIYPTIPQPFLYPVHISNPYIQTSNQYSGVPCPNIQPSNNISHISNHPSKNPSNIHPIYPTQISNHPTISPYITSKFS